jgi:hypothetical protein
MIAALLVSAAFAGSAGGFAVPGAVPAQTAALQLGGLIDGDRAYGQARLEASGHLGRLGLDLELSGLAGGGQSGWTDAGVGTVRIGVRAFIHAPTFENALGIDLRGMPVTDPAVSFWVLRSADARSSLNPRLTWDFTTGPAEAPFSFRLAVGWGLGWLGDSLSSFAGTGVEVSKVFAAGEHWGGLVEAGFVVDGTPFVIRGGARYRPSPHWTVDALVQLPAGLMVVHPVFAPAVQVRGEL